MGITDGILKHYEDWPIDKNGKPLDFYSMEPTLSHEEEIKLEARVKRNLKLISND